MGIILKGEKSLEGKIKRKKVAREKLHKEIKTSKQELRSLRLKQLTAPLTLLLSTSSNNKTRAQKEKIARYKELINNKRLKAEKLDEEITALIKGHQGEEHITNLLKKELSDHYYILSGKKVQTSSQKSGQAQKAEIDHIIVGPKGIICVEVKNMSGKFYYEEREGWLKAPFSSNPTALKVPMQNPLNQIERGTKILKDFINQKGIAHKVLQGQPLEQPCAANFNFYSLVVFTNEKCILHGVKNRWHMPTPLLLKDELITYINSLPLDNYLKNKSQAENLALTLVETS